MNLPFEAMVGTAIPILGAAIVAGGVGAKVGAIIGGLFAGFRYIFY